MIKDYIEFVRNTSKLHGESSCKMYLMLGLVSEWGEVADVYKKAIIHAREVDIEALISELGDVLWYITAWAIETGDEGRLEELLVRNASSVVLGVAGATVEIFNVPNFMNTGYLVHKLSAFGIPIDVLIESNKSKLEARKGVIQRS